MAFASTLEAAVSRSRHQPNLLQAELTPEAFAVSAVKDPFLLFRLLLLLLLLSVVRVESLHPARLSQELSLFSVEMRLSPVSLELEVLDGL